MKRRIITVFWDGTDAIRCWYICEGKKVLGWESRKVGAVWRARSICRDRLPSQLVIKKRNGRIQTEHTYGKDPRKTKG